MVYFSVHFFTQKKAKNTSIIPTFDLPSSTQKDSYKTIFKKTQKNHPKIKCINYFIYGKWKESHFKKIVYYWKLQCNFSYTIKNETEDFMISQRFHFLCYTLSYYCMILNASIIIKESPMHLQRCVQHNGNHKKSTMKIWLFFHCYAIFQNSFCIGYSFRTRRTDTF